MLKSIHHDDYQVAIRILRDMRKEAGLTQVQVAERLGKPQSFVTKYETGERRLDVAEVRIICEALETSFTAFAGRFVEGCSRE